MTISTKPQSAVERVLLNIGDIEQEFITAPVVQYILDKNNNSVSKASIESARYIISFLSKRADEVVGDVEVLWSQILSNYRKLLQDMLSNAAFRDSGGGIYFGGTSKTEMDRVNGNSDSVNGGVKLGMFSSTSGCDVDSNDRFHLNC